MTFVKCKNCGAVQDYQKNNGRCPTCTAQLPKPTMGNRATTFLSKVGYPGERALDLAGRRYQKVKGQRKQAREAREIMEQLPQATVPEAEEAMEKAKSKYWKQEKKEAQARYYAAQTAEFDRGLKSLRGKVKIGFIEIAIPLLVAIIILFFFGISFVFLGIGIFCIPFYLMFRRTILRGETKFIIVFFSWLQFALMTPQLFIALIILWAGYFSMPTKYDEDDTTKATEAWARVILGLLLSFNLYAALGGSTILGVFPTLPPSAEQLPILLMSIAFFFTLPAVKPGASGGVNIYLGLKGLSIPYTVAGRYTGAIIFYTFMIFALVTSLNAWSFSSSLGLSFIIFWFIGLFLGLAGGREGRPYTGVIVVLFAVFFFSAQFSNIVGTQIFGQWWPQILAFGQTTLGPLGQVSTQLTSGIGDAWMLITCPVCYWTNQTIKDTTPTTTTSTVYAIEITRFEFLSPTQLDPQDQPLIGTAELENQGDLNANNINATMAAYWVTPDPDRVRTKVATPKTQCSLGSTSTVSGKCSWPDIYSREIKTISFTFKQGDWFPELMNDTAKDNSYVHAGEMVSVNLSLEFNYNVNSSLPVEIMNEDLYQRLLQSRDVTPVSKSSSYSGGPVKLAIGILQKQPLVNKQEATMLVAIYNDGAGVISSIDSFQIFIPADLNPQSLEGSSFMVGKKQSCSEEPVKVTDSDSPFNNFYKFECNHNKAITTGNFITMSFSIQPDNKGVDRKTYGVVGLATYKYSNSKEIQIQMAPKPLTEVV